MRPFPDAPTSVGGHGSSVAAAASVGAALQRRHLPDMWPRQSLSRAPAVLLRGACLDLARLPTGRREVGLPRATLL
jgi:hypothetical protein